MTSKIALVTALTAALSGGILMAKQETTSPHRGFERGARMEHLSAALNLTDQQKQQAKQIFQSERESTRAIRRQLMEERKAVRSAIQAGKPASEVEALAKNEGPELGNLAAHRAEAFAHFYSVLTPDQQQKLTTLRQEHQARREKRSHENGKRG
jgi:Spy/CpxP family protein refolding chaperone